MSKRHPPADRSTKKLSRRGGFKPGDLAVAAVNPGASAAGAACQLLQVTDDTNADGYTIAHSSTAPFVSYYAASAPAAVSRFNSTVAPGAADGTMYNLGPDPRLDVWQIQNNRVLTRTDVLHATAPMQIAECVINLKAEYGVDADSNGTIDPGEWQTAAPADWRRVLAVRVAVLVRSRQFERSRDAGSASGVSAVTPTALNPYYFGDPARIPDDQRRRQADALPPDAKQLAPLPLPRLRTRHPVAQHALGELGMKSRCLHRPGATHRERGVVLFVALIVLIIMTLAGLALLRDGRRTSIRNVAFRRTRLRSPIAAPERRAPGS
jgi:hypothetical protein